LFLKGVNCEEQFVIYTLLQIVLEDGF